MTRDELIAICRRAPDFPEAKHEEFVDYITVIERRRKEGQQWVVEEAPYMSVDGRLAMANADHRRQGKKLIFHDPVVLVDTPEQLTLMVVVESELYGRRHGIATSRKQDGSPIEREHPWEIAETSALGRALAAMGYGLLPGTGLASAEDVLRAAVTGSPARLTAQQQSRLAMSFAQAQRIPPADALRALERLAQEHFGHPLSECTAQEARDLLSRARGSLRSTAQEGQPERS
mgnify:CR=1 FL=1